MNFDPTSQTIEGKLTLFQAFIWVLSATDQRRLWPPLVHLELQVSSWENDKERPSNNLAVCSFTLPAL